MNRDARWTAGAVMAALAFAGISAMTGHTAYAATGKHRASQAALARTLAVRVSSARTPTSRYNAILAVMRTLHVGVFTGNGKALVRAGRPHEIYLYDFEIKAMAGALGRGQTSAAEDLAGQLTTAGVTPGGVTLTGRKLVQTLAAGTRAALARPRERLSLVALLARELGRRHRPGYDLATAAPDKVRFDALQIFLIDAGVAVAASSRTSRATRIASSAAAGPCDSQASDVVTDSIPFGKWVISLVGPVKDRAKVAALVLDGIHGMVLAFSVAVAPTTRTFAKTHYGPAGHDGNAGKPFDFGVRVVMRDQLPRVVISCGPLLGMKFPEKGADPVSVQLVGPGPALAG